MSVLYVLIPVAIVLAAFWVGVFIWCVRSGQFDEDSSPAQRALWDDDHRP